MNRLRNILFSLTFSLTFANAQTSYNFKLYTTDDGLLENNCARLFQDSKGYLWITNGHGITKYNGRNFDNILDKGLAKEWGSISSVFENGNTQIICNSSSFVYNLSTQKYLKRDTMFGEFLVEGKEDIGLLAATTYLNRKLIKVFTTNKQKYRTKDTIYFNIAGKINFTIFPKKSSTYLSFFEDRLHNVYVSGFDETSKRHHLYLFENGKLKYLTQSHVEIIKIETDLQDNLIVFQGKRGYTFSEIAVSIYNKTRGLIASTPFTQLNRFSEFFDCLIDKDNSVWIPTRSGLMRFDLKSGFKSFRDNDRHFVFRTSDKLDNGGKTIIFKDTIDENYNYLAIDKTGNIINGDRIFNGSSFSDLIPFQSSQNQDIGSLTNSIEIQDLLCDRENNVWLATTNGLIKATILPFNLPQTYLYKNAFDFKLNYTDGYGRKFFLRHNEQNRTFDLKIQEGNDVVYSKTYKRQNISSQGSDLQEYLRFIPYGKNAALCFNGLNNLYNLCFYTNKEIGQIQFPQKQFKIDFNSYLYHDTSSMIFVNYEFCKSSIFKYDKTGIREILLKPEISRKLDYSYYGSEVVHNYFGKANKILDDRLTILKIQNNNSVDTIPFSKMTTQLRYSMVYVSSVNYGSYKLIALDSLNNFYFLSETKYEKYELNKNVKNAFSKNQLTYFSKIIILKDLVFLCKNSSLLLYQIDTLKKTVSFKNQFTFKNGLLAVDWNDFFVSSNYLVNCSEDQTYLTLFTYESIINNGLNDPIRIKIPALPNLKLPYTIDFGKWLKLDDGFLNSQAPIININAVTYVIEGESNMDSLNLLNYPSAISNLSFNYDAVSLSDGDYVQTKYNVVGLDTNWQSTSGNKIIFPTLPPGSYTLQIKACNNHQIWSAPLQIKFTIKYPWYRTWLAYFIYLIGFSFSLYSFVKYRTNSLEKEKAKLEQIVLERTKEVIDEKKVVELQKHEIEEKHKEIKDSINYAERIQRSFMATKELLDENLKDYFVFFQPKDVVSGDFYWASKLNNGNFALVTADSTGHGVPGAIMSLLNISSLEKSIEKETEPAAILNSTRKIIIERLKKDGSEQGGKDGMDCSLISFDFKNGKITYAAANNPIWIVRDDQMIELEPDKMPVGKHDKDTISFSQFTVDIQKGDIIYALTDGMPDQFGGPRGKKFMYKPLKELIKAVSSKPMLEQKELLQAALNNWKADLEQVDDVTLIGVRV